MSEPDLVLRVDRKLSEVARVGDAIEVFWDAHHLPEDRKLDVLTAIEEVLSNIVRHGGAAPWPEDILVHAAFRDDEIEIRFEDSGPPFDPLSYPPPRLDLALQERTGGGLGIHLLRRLMDRVHYERAGDRNCFTMACRVSHGANR